MNKQLKRMKTPYLILLLVMISVYITHLTSCKPGAKQPTPPPPPTPVEYIFPLCDYQFEGTIQDIIDFEKKNNRVYDEKNSTRAKLVFTSEDPVFPQVIYTLEGNKISTIDQPCSKDKVLKTQVPRIKEKLLAAGWSEWTEATEAGRADEAFQLIKEIDGQEFQVGTAVVFFTTDYAKGIIAGVYFIFNHPKKSVDPTTVHLPWVYLEAIGKSPSEIIPILKEKSKSVEQNPNFVIAHMDAPGFGDQVRYFIDQELNRCTSVLLTSTSFRINRSDNIATDIKNLGFDFRNEDKYSKFFYNTKANLWAIVRITPATQLSQPNIVFSDSE